jgi:hypothetical protein
MDVAVLRALLALAAIAALFFKTTAPFYINISVSVILFSLSVFVRMILLKYSIRPILLAGVSAVLFFVATHAAGLAVVLLLAGILPTFFYKTPLVEVGKENVVVKKMIGSTVYEWEQFGNLILKDNLLTLDFKNNKVLQLEIEENTAIDEKAFNAFCASHLIQ